MITKRLSLWKFRQNYFCKFKTRISQIAKREKHVFDTNGPSLKDFIKSSSLNELNAKNRQEELSNDIFLNNIKNHQQYMDDFKNVNKKRKVFFEVHGCQMNINDTEVAYSVLDKTGLYTKTDHEKDADVVLIMTCSIRENAEQKIWNRLREFLHQKRLNKDLQIGILGCMAERLKEKILDKEKMVDIVCGPDSYRLLPELLNQSSHTGNPAMNVQLSLEETYADLAPLRINSSNKNAFISIQRGCDNMCSFVSLFSN